MKTKIILLFSLAFAGLTSHATHIRAGEIIFKITGNLSIEATVITYTKYDGISIQADQDTITISWGDGNFSTLCRSNGPSSGSGCHDGVIISTEPVKIKKNEYPGSHTYAVTPPDGFYIISYFEGNRIDGINNIDGGQSVNIPFYIEDTIFNSDFLPGIGLNSSPVFLNPPVDYANMNDTFRFDPVIFDKEGDSVGIEAIVPLQDHGLGVPFYSFPDQYCQALSQSNNSVQINQQTGQIIWATPCQIGIYLIALVVREYRCGELLSTVERDMQIIVLQETNDPPSISPVHDTIIQPGDSLSINLSASDPDFGQSVSLQALGGAFLSAQNPPVFHSTSGNPAIGNFSWQTDSSSARQAAYIFSISARDNYAFPGVPPIPAGLKNYQTFRVWVADTNSCLFSGIEDLNQGGFSIHLFPNPANTSISVSCDRNIHLIQIFDLSGRNVLTRSLNANYFVVDVSGFAQGIYIVSTSLSDNIVNQKFIKTD